MTTEKTRGERRAETARRTDDSELIEDSPPTPETVGRSGGDLQRDVATADPENEIRKPGTGDNLTKEQELDHGTSSQSDSDRPT